VLNIKSLLYSASHSSLLNCLRDSSLNLGLLSRLLNWFILLNWFHYLLYIILKLQEVGTHNI